MIHLGIFSLLLICQLDAIDPYFSKIHMYVLSPIEVDYHARRAQVFRNQIIDEVAKTKAKEKPTIDFVTKRENTAADFVYDAILLEDMNSLSDKHWIVFCNEETRFNLTLMYKFLDLNDFKDDFFMGLTLHDSEHSIIHHFDSPNKVVYPDVAAGFAISIGLVKKLIPFINDQKSKIDFRIDTSYEFAKFIQENTQVKMERIDGFCASKFKSHCFTWISQHGLSPKCSGSPITHDDVIIAVKTWSGNFNSRIPTVKSLWSGNLPNLLYFADVKNEDIPTIGVDVKNSKTGHCPKLVKILQHVANEPAYSNKKFLFIADDDTLVSIPRLYNLLSCYASERQMALGERYGYISVDGRGYKYLTGGSGMVLSLDVVKALIPLANCQSISDPDDMFLGMWLKSLGVSIVHSPLFHQARPMDYSEDLLAHQKPISFHKFNNLDPAEIYRKYLNDDFSSLHKSHHQEL